MKSQHSITKKIWWKLGLLAIAPLLIYTVSTSSTITASEIETTSKPVPKKVNLADNIPEKGRSIISEQSAEENSSITSQEDPLDFSDTGRAGQQTAGEGRGQCNSSEFPLTALVPTSNWGKTIKEHPTFWFYVPSYSRPVSEIEFVLQDQDRRNLWKKRLFMNETSGYLNVSLPENQPGLETGKWYRWYLKVYCDREKNSPPVVVYGWVTRVEMDSTLSSQLQSGQAKPHKVYSKSGIWFDAIDSILSLKRYSDKPINPNCHKYWQKLTKAKGVNLKLPQPKFSNLAVKARDY
ncbi:MAG: DUF928 domain-containing protein [Xenococcaceae cyanobacterium MO_167.B27]|nr:DUF928 domain-containing protein [Xenococcaceae cyanobacterium MO_167.B27]